MSKPRFMYQTIQVPNRMPMAGGPSARGTAVAAGVKLLHKASVALNRWSVSYRVNRELEKMAEKIEQAMQAYEVRFQACMSDTGVLVVVGTMEWEHPDATGTRAQSFLSIHIGGAGSDARKVLREYLATPSMVQGAPRGWRRKDAYIWVTRESMGE